MQRSVNRQLKTGPALKMALLPERERRSRNNREGRAGPTIAEVTECESEMRRAMCGILLRWRKNLGF
ncbi:hypothetical protein EYF80_010563 [Liparis tanakae]|uniref:Uncharacterized protein n=1 Tax=Liparis tanakae TaxID=230148 RepID=A0A4Z2INT6_9TELE|nr:hypothetical protein EYF80_010563 [Liparis tanakae]